MRLRVHLPVPRLPATFYTLRAEDLPSVESDSTRILIVDDDESMRLALSKYLSKAGYEVAVAESGEKAISRLANERFSVALVDLRMTGMSGMDVVPAALELDPELAILMLSAVNDAHSAAICMQRGALDYLTKPIELVDLEKAIQRAVKKRDTAIQNTGISSWMKDELQDRTRQLDAVKAQQQQITVATLEALVNALEAKDSFQIGHSARVADLAATIATQLDLPDDEIEMIRTAGRLHDLGKIGVKESVLNKAGPLTQEEYDHVKDHVIIGSRILEPLTHLGPIISFVRSHHEHWDGSGYPDQLEKEDIPIGGRIICAAEIYDALVTSRPYQEKLPADAATERMDVLSGSVLDPNVIAALKTAVSKRQTLTFIGDE